MPTRSRTILAWIVVILMVVAVWKFVDYRNRPPKAIPYVIRTYRTY
jgi:type II secretory pathway component PulM